MNGDECPRLTQQEIDFLLGIYSCEKARALAPGAPGEAGPSAAPCFPNVLREGAQGLGLSIGEAAFLWRALLDALFEKEMGLSPTQWVIVWALAARGGEQRKDRLAPALGIDPLEMNAELAGLERRGLVKLIDPPPEGGSAGATACIGDFSSMQRLMRLTRSLRDDALEGVDEKDVAAMHATLLKILGNLRAMSGRLKAPQAPRSAETSS